jgi:hypothetical protein
MANEKITDYVNLVTTLANGDLLDVSKDTVGDGSVWESQGMTQLVLRTTLGVNGTTNYIPVYDGTKIVPSTIYQSAGGNYGVFGVTTPTFSWSFGGDSLRSIGMERRSGSSASGFAFSVVSGGAAVGSTNQDAGDLQFATGPSTGNGTGRMTWSLPAPNQGSGTTTRAQSVKMYLLGSGWLGIGQSPSAPFEVFTENTLSKMRFGHNLKSVCGVTTLGGLEIARADGIYTLCPSIYMGSDYNMYFGGGNGSRAFGFVTNPQTDTFPQVILGGTYGGIQAGVGTTSAYMYHFHRTWTNSGNSSAAYFSTSGTNTSGGTNVALMELVNTATNVNGSNYGLQISVTGSSTGTNQNVAISTTNGKIVFYGQKGDYDVSFGATANRTFGVNREVIPATGGRSLTFYAGSAVLAGTNLAGGNWIAETGTGTGSGGADFIVKTSTPGASGTTDRTPTEKVRVKGSGNVGVGTSTPDVGALLDLTSSSLTFLTTRLTGDAASALTPTNGMSTYITSTNGTFTSVGFWGYEAGSWKKYTLI